ncbi:MULTISPECIES: carbohydrate ABC transporter permease [Clostridium]|jgi:multiple sugar transport system permease protein|uniref:Sugar ABC transporter permease n=1 Tax=Clostridium butyricum TaxID=1492 RepID=A0A512TMP5_CLOBU|nr:MULTISPECIES: sugar ABC transporter permease [Clostridium]MDU4853334.1 sugar ABC transporter permease [Clostridioides difficile]MBO1686922.1 sugar ABC transporter permease [Clostridium butyricum]MBS5983712.1 sugar ABC transporter permease [Clostridium butyricum]MBZ0311898.1 sugar ABC transporter permease [Clostridium butyricum]MDB2136878.1 sugar ABC transporter permease [Clostridium butyricum]
MAAKIKSKSDYYARERRAGYLFVLAPVLQFFLFAFIPLAVSLYAGFTDWTSIGTPDFIGISNYKEMFSDTNFWKSIGNTIFMMIGIPIGLVIALGLALAMNRRVYGAKTFRVIYYIPVISSIAAVSILWRWVYNGDYGLLNQILSVIGIQGPNWLNNEMTVKPAIVAMTVWKGLGMTILLYLAGIQSIPKSLNEAAQIDGANAFQAFKHITIPMLKPVTFYLIITGIIGGSQMFIEPSIMVDNGGVNYSAATVVYYLWDKAFKNYQMGYACAVGWVLAIFIFAITFVQFKYSSGELFED